jgi:hypothetical protein
MKYSAIIFAALYMIIRVLLFLTGFDDDQYKYIVGLNLLFIILSIAGALYANYLSGKEIVLFPDEMKVAMRAVSVYAITLTLFTFVYYSYIDAGFAQRKIDVLQYEIEKTDYSSMPDQENPLIVLGLTKEEFVEKEVEKASTFLSSFSQATLTLMALMAVGLIYSLILVIIRMKLLPILFRK